MSKKPITNNTSSIIRRTLRVGGEIIVGVTSTVNGAIDGAVDEGIKASKNIANAFKDLMSPSSKDESLDDSSPESK